MEKPDAPSPDESDEKDPYMDSDLNSDEFNIGMNDYQQEEKKAFSTPLSAGEMTKMESNGKNLLKDITSGMKEYGKD